MSIPFSAVEGDLQQLRKFVLNDLEKIVRQPKGGNYAAVAVITCACEAFGRLRYGKRDGGRDFFVDKLLPSKWRGVGGSMYDALRNGIVHGYETKVLKLPGRDLEIRVSWRDKPHLTFNESRSVLYVNIAKLAEDLKRAIAEFEQDLRRDKELRDRFREWWKIGREVCIRDPESRKWEVLLERPSPV